MWRRGVCAEEQTRDQTGTATTSNVTREIAAACVKSAKPVEITVGRNIAVAAENAAGPLPEIGNHHDIRLVISGAGFDPCFPLSHIIGRSEIGVAVSATDFQATEFVDQEEVDHAGDSVRTVHRRCAVLKDIDVIDHDERYQVDIRARAKTPGAQRTEGDPLAIDQD